MAAKGVVAIVGRPNVGKSTLFNRVIKRRLSIVEDTPGVTRDRIYSSAEWLTREFNLIDTGGIEIKDAPFQKQIKAQVQIAIEEADVIIFVVSAKEGVTNDDEFIAKMLFKVDKEVILVVNKCDNEKLRSNADDFWALGVGQPHPVTSTHGVGLGDVLDDVVQKLPKNKKKDLDSGIRFSIIGKPNVGKSSLANAIIGEERVIVSDIAGTTRDAIDTPFKRDGKEYIVIDTAGMRKRGRIYENVEKYSVLRANGAVDRSEITLLMIDGSQPISDQDLNISQIVWENKKPCMIVVNKWDLVKDGGTQTMVKFEKNVREFYHHLSYAPIVFVSALENKRVGKIFEKIDEIYDNLNTRIRTSVLNEIISKAQLMNEAPEFNGGRLTIYYSIQAETGKPTFILFCNNPSYLHFSYRRYIENKIRESFPFEGIPLRIQFRERK